MSISPLQTNLHADNNMNTTTDIYTDLNGLQNLKQTAVKDSLAALPEAARQFEAVMITMLMKNLRKTAMEDPIFNSQAEDSYRDMYDQQLGLELSKGQGIGVAQSIILQLRAQQLKAQQLSAQQLNAQQSVETDNESGKVLTMPKRQVFPDYYSKISQDNKQNENHGLQNNTDFQAPDDSVKAVIAYADITKPGAQLHFDSPAHFVKKLWPLAEKAAEKLGVSTEVILSQAALETGWGKHIINNGTESSHNLFNIKANPGWNGKQIAKSSMEFIQGQSLQQKSAFRAYDSLQQSFDDYVNFLQNNPRYKKVLDNIAQPEQQLRQKTHDSQQDSTYIKALHHAGYATDPYYSDKVLKILNSEVIQNQLQSHFKMAAK